MRKILAVPFAAAGAAALVLSAAAPALAAVDFGPAAGSGFAGKGDVQLAFTWNNTQLQRNAKDVTFTYVAKIVQEQDCVVIDGHGQSRVVRVVGERTRTSGIDSLVAYDARVRNQLLASPSGTSPRRLRTTASGRSARRSSSRDR